MSKPKHVWMVRAGNNNEIAEVVEAKNAVAIGWSEMHDLSELKTREQFKQKYQIANPEETSKSRIAVNSGQVFRFARQIEIGDYVLTYLQASRELLIGEVVGEYSYQPKLINPHYPQIRPVNWLRKVSRDEFSAPARNTLGSSLTVFLVDEHLDEIHLLATSDKPKPAKKPEEEPPFHDEVKAKADELISDMVSKLEAYKFQDLVAALLRAMGYQAISVKPGPDKGVDIEAAPDPLGFEEPRVKVQVKHRIKIKVSGPEMYAFSAVLKPGDHGLYVSTGGFTPDARNAALQAQKVIKLLDREQFIALLLEYYDKLEPEYKAFLPLRRVWVPVE